jgi:hypothetical protein
MKIMHEAPKRKPFSAEARAEAFAKRSSRYKQPVDGAHVSVRQQTPQRGARNYARVQVLSRREPMPDVRPLSRMTPQEAQIMVRSRNLAAREAQLAYREGMMAAQPAAYSYPQKQLKKKKSWTERARKFEVLMLGNMADKPK